MRISINEKRQKTVKARRNLKIHNMLSSNMSTRPRTAVIAFGVLIGLATGTSSAIAASGPHPSLNQYSADFLAENPYPDSDFPIMEIADVGGMADEDGEYLIQVQLAQAEDDVNDPFESFNRAMFGFNEIVYDGVLGPVADVYNVLPTEARTIVSSFFSNLGEPIVFINDLLQGEFERALTTFTRFSMNTVFGFGGLADVATAAGIEGHDEDFGQTLAVWGVDEGFYLVLPVLGPSNPRDAVGRFLIDSMVDPVNIQLDNHGEDDLMVPRAVGTGFTEFASIRDELITLKKNSIDYYAAIRSLYRQKREIEISNGEGMDIPPIPDFEFSDYPIDDTPAPALGTTDDGDTEDNGEVSALPSASLDSYSLVLDPFSTAFDPARHGDDVGDADATATESGWQAEVILVTAPR
jgi:phospholipid-binding lipoprotein MlaA